MATMKRTLLTFSVLGLIICGSGCASIATHAGGGDEDTRTGVYRGVRYGCRHLTDDQGGGILIFDIPLSAVADTLLLPYDLSHD